MIKLKILLLEKNIGRTIFFSHPRMTYGTPVEDFWMKKLKRKFSSYKIENPNSDDWTKLFFKQGEKAFLDFIEKSMMTIALPLSSTELSDGVAQELSHSLKVGIPTYVIRNNKLKRIHNLNSFKILNNTETEKRLHDAGIHHLNNPVLDEINLEFEDD